MAPVLSCPLWLHSRILPGNLCDCFWWGKPSLPLGTLGSCTIGSRSCMALAGLLWQLLPCDWPCADLPPPNPSAPCHPPFPFGLMLPLTVFYLASTGWCPLTGFIGPQFYYLEPPSCHLSPLHFYGIYLVHSLLLLAYSFSSPTSSLPIHVCSLAALSRFALVLFDPWRVGVLLLRVVESGAGVASIW